VWKEDLFLGRCIFVTSFKGGVGKSFVTANLAGALTSLGKKVLIADGDLGMRSMDILLGCESGILFDIKDVINGVCPVDSAIIKSGTSLSPDFIPAPQTYDGSELDGERTRALFRYLKSVYDYVLIDSSAEYSPYYSLLASCADTAVIVTAHQSTAVRAAEKTACLLAKEGLTQQYLVINMFRKKEADKGLLPDPADMILASSVPLIGIVPWDKNVAVEAEKGRIAFSKKKGKAYPYEGAAINIAYRLCGNQIPLFKGVYRTLKRKYYLT
jgi:septum site-determining protein MinD